MDLIDFSSSISTFDKHVSCMIDTLENKKLLHQESQAMDSENQELIREINILKEETSALKKELSEKNSANSKLMNDLSSLKDSISESERKCNEQRKGLDMKESDNSRILKAKEMLNIGIDFTGIRWDFLAPKTVAKGYIANKENRKLIPFSVDKSILTEDKVQAMLWNNIESTSSSSWRDFVNICDIGEGPNKENITNN